MDELISNIDVAAIERAINKGVEYGGEFFVRFQDYAILINTLWLLFSLIGFLICILVIRPTIKWVADGKNKYSNDRLLIWILWFICFGLMITFICILSNELIKAIYVPEVYLLQYITK